jgi:hypothetical protein
MRGNAFACVAPKLDQTPVMRVLMLAAGVLGPIWCLRMKALRPVIVLRSNVQKLATSARRDSARIECSGTVYNACSSTPEAAVPAGSTSGHPGHKASGSVSCRSGARTGEAVLRHRKSLLLWERCGVLDTRSHDDHWTKCHHPQTPYRSRFIL